MPQLPRAVGAWPSADFAATLKNEIEHLGARALPLDRATRHGGRADDDAAITVTVLHVGANDAEIQAAVGIFFDEILAGCSCGDDPQTANAYGEFRVTIDKATTTAVFASA